MMTARHVLVTGATGMVGRRLCEQLNSRGDVVTRVGRTASDVTPVVRWQAGDSLAHAMAGVDAVVHLAAHVHVRGKGYLDADAFSRINTEATIRVAEEAAACGVRRFVFLSSIGVLGGASSEPSREDDAPAPHTSYALSKWQAEQELLALRGIEIVVLRPPAVVGAGVRGNLKTIVQALKHGLPLPFSSIRNERQFLTLNNLVDAIMLSLFSDAAAGEIFHVANAEKVSTPQLCRELANLLATTPRLVPFPPSLLRGGLSLLRRRAIGDGLTQDLLIDTGKIRAALDWQPRESLREGLRDMLGVAE